MRKYFLTIALLSSYVSYGQLPAYRNKQFVACIQDAGALSFYDKDMKLVVEPGTFTIMAGVASDKTTSVSLTVIP